MIFFSSGKNIFIRCANGLYEIILLSFSSSWKYSHSLNNLLICQTINLVILLKVKIKVICHHDRLLVIFSVFSKWKTALLKKLFPQESTDGWSEVQSGFKLFSSICCWFVFNSVFVCSSVWVTDLIQFPAEKKKKIQWSHTL